VIVILLLLNYLVVPLLGVWVIVRTCNKSAQEFDKQEETM
jgi:hypothetical protein